MDIHKNEKDELRLWAKKDIVPNDLQELCKQAANSIEELQERIEELETAKTIGIQACDLLKEQIKELEAECTRLRSSINNKLEG